MREKGAEDVLRSTLADFPSVRQLYEETILSKEPSEEVGDRSDFCI
jgi:hypothetical protein